MLNTIPNLWPTNVRTEVQTPYTILRVQAELLSKVTKGILQGAVETDVVKEKTQHQLVVVAPRYNSYRVTLLKAVHDPNLPYPTRIEAAALAKKTLSEGKLPGFPQQVAEYPCAHGDEQMLNLVQEALQSEQTRAVLLSLIAMSNDATAVASPTVPQVRDEMQSAANRNEKKVS
jgi:hypothetical protein